jgi:hypothetical protein
MKKVGLCAKAGIRYTAGCGLFFKNRMPFLSLHSRSQRAQRRFGLSFNAIL